MFLFFAALILVIFGPLFVEIFRFEYADSKMRVVVALAVALMVATLIFVGVETLFLKLLGVDVSFHDISAGVSYATAPLTLVIVSYYAIDYSLTGELNIVTYLITGYAHFTEKFLLIFPWVHLAAKIFIVIIFMNVLRSAGGMHILTATMVTVLSLGVFYSGLIVGIKFTDMYFPRTLDNFLNVLFELVRVF